MRGEPMVAFQSGLTVRDRIDAVLTERDVEVEVALEFDNIETIKRAIEIGAGFSLLPLPTVEQEIAGGTLAAVSLTGPPLVRPLGIIHRRDRELSEMAGRFVDLLQTHACDASDPSTNGRNGYRTPRQPQEALG